MSMSLALPAIVSPVPLAPVPVDDVELVRRIAARDTGALRELYDRYGAIVHGMAYRTLGDRQLAEDCTQEVFVAVWKGAGRYDPARAQVTTWMLSIARNRAVDAVRWHEHRRAEPLPEAWSHGEAPDAAEIAVAAEQSEQIAAALAELPGVQREALSLAYFGGLSQAEIADRLGVPLGTIKSRIRLALERLRSVLPKYALDVERGS